MQLTYRDMEDLLADLHDIAPGARIALQGRIKHFQRYGWPGGTNTGKGRAASYGFGQVLKLCLGFELLQLGVTPERAVGLLRDNWDHVRTATSLAVGAHPVLGRSPDREEGNPFDVFIYCDPNALAGLTDAESDPSDSSFFYTSSLQLGRKLLEHGVLDAQRLALINLSVVLDSIAQHLPELDNFRTSYVAWDAAEREAEEEAYNAENGAYPEEHHSQRAT